MFQHCTVFNKVCHIFLWAYLTIELLKLCRLIIDRFKLLILAVYGLKYVKEDVVATSYLSLMVHMMKSLIWFIGIVPSEET